MPFWNRQDQEDPTSFTEAFEMEMPTLPPMSDDFETSLQEWKLAIRTAKANSAPGADGFTFREIKMLPDELLVHLIRIIASMDKFPAHLMLARTVPIPKKDELTAENSRPITILSTLYRLWGRTCGRRCLRHFSRYMPNAITGMLPKRGAFSASYMMQAILEIHRKTKVHITGLTLDLKKCFNLLCRSKVQQLMISLGVPPRLVRKWAQSLDEMCRFWDISKLTSSPMPVSNGCPEGDSWSVVAMLVTAHTWCCLMKHKNPQSEMSSYADNWTIWTPDQHISSEPAVATSRFVSWMGLQISWDKTWFWSTGTTGAKKLQDCLRPIFPANETPIKATATDLGCQLTYHGNSKLGAIHERFEQAKKRLEVIRQSNWALPQKVQVIQMAVLPLALYGTEPLTVGQKLLTNLRTAIVDALVGEHVQTLSSAIFIQCVDLRDLDPCFKVILNAVKQARRFLRKSTADEKSLFLQIASSPGNFQGLTQGPASALREYLQRLGLQCSPTGDIMMTAMRHCNLMTTSFRDLRKYLRMNWQCQILMHHTQRPKLYNLTPINPDATHRLLRKYKPKQQLLLLREIAGGFQTQQQQSNWNDADGICNFCHSHPDTKIHRTFDCIVFQEIRQPFTDMLDELREMNEDIVELPVIHVHPHYEFHDALLHSMPQPKLDVDLISKLRTLGMRCPTFYTDGSCKYPTSPGTSYSAFAIVCDVCCTDEQRKDFACTYRYTEQFPNALQVVAIGRTQGHQAIHRAELQALLVLFEQLDMFEAYTDSATAIACIDACRRAADLEELADHDDFDLLQRFFLTVSREKKVHKIKAHQKLVDISDDLLLFRALGNHMADQSANKACVELLPEVVAQLEEFHADFCQQQTILKQFFDLNLQLQTARAQVTQQDGDIQYDNSGNKQDLFCNWTISSPWTFPNDIGDDEVLHTAWSLQWSVAILNWMENCSWPLEPTEGDPGLSWVELALSLVLSNQMWLPVKRLRAGQELILQPITADETESLQLTLAEQATVAYSMVTQIMGLVVKG